MPEQGVVGQEIMAGRARERKPICNPSRLAAILRALHHGVIELPYSNCLEHDGQHTTFVVMRHDDGTIFFVVAGKKLSANEFLRVAPWEVSAAALA